jgi:hypothetical protein
MDIINNWKAVKTLFRESFKTSFHYSIATVSESGEPHVTPIGSLILGQPGKGFYFEEFTSTLPKHYASNRQICVLAVNSGRWFWLKALIKGKFTAPPAVRLYGTVGQRREATTTEITLWHKRVKSVRFSKGHSLMWANMKMVRDIEFSKIIPVHMGQMTRETWSA